MNKVLTLTCDIRWKRNRRMDSQSILNLKFSFFLTVAGSILVINQRWCACHFVVKFTPNGK